MTGNDDEHAGVVKPETGENADILTILRLPMAPPSCRVLPQFRTSLGNDFTEEIGDAIC